MNTAANTKTRKLTPSEAIKAIRATLKAKFPTIKFSVRKDGHSSCRIGWLNGPSAKMVDEVTAQFENGTFNGMVDSYEYADDNRPGGLNYIFTDRETAEIFANVCVAIASKYSADCMPSEYDLHRMAHGALLTADLSNGFNGVELVGAQWSVK